MVKIMANIAVDEDQGHDSIQPYGMHVSSRYLDLTRRKLELTRLPRELQLPNSRRWEYGTPKAVLEPLIDFWLKRYDWRTQEALFNNALPQFRTTLRVHFVHKRSKHRNAIPLLFCHGWPSSFIELYKIVDALTDPVSLPSYGIGAQQAFHVVAPSIPGFGFSDASPVEGFGLRGTAGAFDEVMSRLGYAKRGYVVHGAGWGFKICRALALYYPQHCLAVHTTNPSLPQPTMRRDPMVYLKYQIASFTHAKFSYLNFGYVPADFAPAPQTLKNTQSNELGASGGGFDASDAALASQYSQRSQTVSYSLCDSPIGLLACMLDALHSRSAGSTFSLSQSPFLPLSELSQQASQQASRKASQQPATVDNEVELQIQPAPPAQIVLSPWHSETNGQDYTWAPTEILSWTMMQWLPGPEAGLRWLKQASHDSSHANPAFWETYSTVPLGISQFRPTRGSTESPLMWAETVQNLAWAKRHPRSARWPAWEAPDLLVLDLRECFGGWVESGVVRVARDDAEDN